MKRLIALTALALAGAPAWAHSGLTGGLALWDGATHILLSPLSLAAIAGLAAILCGIEERRIYAVSIAVGICAGVAHGVAPYLPACAVPGAIAMVGLIGVAAWKPSPAAEIALSLVAGLAGGAAASLDAPNLPTIAGAVLAQMLLLAIVLMGYRDLNRLQALAPILPIARRVLASWVTAMGLLMTALAFHSAR